jgi:hypothetical protein
MVSSVLNQMHGQMVATERQAILPRYDPLDYVSLNAIFLMTLDEMATMCTSMPLCVFRLQCG